MAVIWYGDLCRVVSALEPDDEALEEILAMLRLRPPPGPPPSISKPEPRRPLNPPTPEPSRVSRKAMPSPAYSAGTLLRLSDDPLISLPLPDSGPLLDDSPPSGVRGPFDPLFKPRCQARVVSTAVATRLFEGEVVIQEVVDLMARAKPVRVWPRRAVPTLRRGVEVLVDVGEGMLPYSRDRAGLADSIRRTVGKDRTRIRSFAGTPTRGVWTATEKPGRWRAPPRGTVVVLLTDFGIGGSPDAPERGEPHEWLRFLDSARAGGCPVVAFVPYRHSRVSARLLSRITYIHWDRTTVVSTVRRAVGIGHRTLR